MLSYKNKSYNCSLFFKLIVFFNEKIKLLIFIKMLTEISNGSWILLSMGIMIRRGAISRL